MTFVQNQGNQQIQTVQPQIKPIAQQQVPQIVQPQPFIAPQVVAPPQVQTPASPNYAGVNIQIFNPSVGVPNLNPTGNMVNSQALPGIAYPPNYYTNQYGTNPYANGQLPNGSGQYASAPGGIIAQGGAGGTANVYNTFQTPNQNGWADTTQGTGNNANAIADKNANNAQNSNTSIDKLMEEANKLDNKKKTEKRKVVELTDEYIMNLENYLNSKDKEVRMMGAKEVIARLQEDDSRKDDPALTALINKMLQDPDQKIRFLALSMLEARTCTGNDYTVGVLQKMQQGTSGYGQDAAQATSVLLKMSGKVVEKEFEVPENSAKK